MKISLTSILLLGFLSTSSYANTNTNNLDVSANISSGCNLHMNDIHIGFIEGTANYMNTNTAKEFPLNIAIHCSKGTQFTIQSQIANGRPRPSVDNISGDTSDPLQYVFPMFRNDDPRDYEFIGYRLNIVNPSDRLGSTSKYFGNGNPNDIGYNTSYLGGTGTGAIQEFNLLFQYWALKILRDGDYSANHTFTITY